MLRKICYSLIFVCLIASVALSLVGITHVETGDAFYAYLNSIATKALDYKIEIPKIPEIPFENYDKSVWYDILNVLVQFVNFLSKIINVLIIILNTIIQIFEFFYFIIDDFETFIDVLKGQNSLVYIPPTF